MVFRMVVEPHALIADARVFASADQARSQLAPSARVYFIAHHNAAQEAAADKWEWPAGMEPQKDTEKPKPSQPTERE